MPAESATLPGDASVTPAPSPMPSTDVLNVLPLIDAIDMPSVPATP